MPPSNALVEQAMANAVLLGLEPAKWDAKFFVQLDTRNAKALKSVLYFFLAEVFGKALKEQMAFSVKFLGDPKCEPQFRSLAFSHLEMLVQRGSLPRECVRKSDLQTCSGMFPRMLLLVSHAAMRARHQRKLSASCVPLPSSPEGTAVSEARLRSLKLQALVQAQLLQKQQAENETERETWQEFASGLLSRLQHTRTELATVRAERQRLNFTPRFTEQERSERMARLSRVWDKIQAQHELIQQRKGLVESVVGNSEQEPRLSAESLREALSNHRELEADGVDEVDLVEVVRGWNVHVSQTLKAIEPFLLGHKPVVPPHSLEAIKREVVQHQKFSGSLTTLHASLVGTLEDLRRSIARLQAQYHRVAVPSWELPTGKVEPCSPSQIGAHSPLQMLPPTPERSLSFAAKHSPELQLQLSPLASPVHDQSDEPYALTPLTTSRVLQSVRKCALARQQGHVLVNDGTRRRISFSMEHPNADLPTPQRTPQRLFGTPLVSTPAPASPHVRARSRVEPPSAAKENRGSLNRVPEEVVGCSTPKKSVPVFAVGPEKKKTQKAPEARGWQESLLDSLERHIVEGDGERVFGADNATSLLSRAAFQSAK